MREKTSNELKENLCKHLDELATRNLDDLTLKHIQMLTDSYKNILKIEMLEQVDEEYNGTSQRRRYSRSYGDGSYDGRSYDGGSYSDGSYDGHSNAPRGEHWVRGHYSRGYDDDMSMAYDRRSYADGKDHVMRELEQIMNKTNSEQDRNAIKRCMEQIKQA